MKPNYTRSSNRVAREAAIGLTVLTVLAAIFVVVLVNRFSGKRETADNSGKSAAAVAESAAKAQSTKNSKEAPTVLRPEPSPELWQRPTSPTNGGYETAESFLIGARSASMSNASEPGAGERRAAFLPPIKSGFEDDVDHSPVTESGREYVGQAGGNDPTTDSAVVGREPSDQPTLPPIAAARSFENDEPAELPDEILRDLAEPREIGGSFVDGQTSNRIESDNSFDEGPTLDLQPADSPRVLQAAAIRPIGGTLRTLRDDSFWSISERVYGTGIYFKALYEHNRERFPEPDRIAQGREVDVPSLDELKRLYPELCSLGGEKDTVVFSQLQQPEQPKTRPYVVRQGETLWDIARYELGQGSRYVEILRLNRDRLGDDYNHPRAGTTLQLPVEAAPVVDPGGFNRRTVP